MDKEKSGSRKLSRSVPRSPSANSPRLLRSKSGMSLPEIHTTAVPKPVNRSKSTTKLRSYKDQVTKNEKCSQEIGNSLTKFLQRNNGRSSSTHVGSPSAWALSPGRSLPTTSPAPIVPKSPSSTKLKTSEHQSSSRGAVAGVFNYFKQKKVSPVLEEEFHQYRILNNILLQWRFVNARAQASMSAVNKVSQKKLFNAWLRISIMRNFTAEKRIQVQKLKQDIKINKIMNSQGSLLREWQRLEVKNSEAVGRVARKLSAVSLCLPLVDGAEGDVMSVYDAMNSAQAVMDGIEDFIENMQWQVEQSCYLLTELIVILKQEKEYLEELQKYTNTIASLEVEEESLKAHRIQLANEWIRVEGACDLELDDTYTPSFLV